MSKPVMCTCVGGGGGGGGGTLSLSLFRAWGIEGGLQNHMHGIYVH